MTILTPPTNPTGTEETKPEGMQIDEALDQIEARLVGVAASTPPNEVRMLTYSLYLQLGIFQQLKAIERHLFKMTEMSNT